MSWDNRNRISVARGRNTAIANETTLQGNGQIIYNQDRHYITVGEPYNNNNRTPANNVPIRVRTVEGWCSETETFTDETGNSGINDTFQLSSTPTGYYLLTGDSTGVNLISNGQDINIKSENNNINIIALNLNIQDPTTKDNVVYINTADKSITSTNYKIIGNDTTTTISKSNSSRYQDSLLELTNCKGFQFNSQSIMSSGTLYLDEDSKLNFNSVNLSVGEDNSIIYSKIKTYTILSDTEYNFPTRSSTVNWVGYTPVAGSSETLHIGDKIEIWFNCFTGNTQEYKMCQQVEVIELPGSPPGQPSFFISQRFSWDTYNDTYLFRIYLDSNNLLHIDSNSSWPDPTNITIYQINKLNY